jgi:hypothetical protein
LKEENEENVVEITCYFSFFLSFFRGKEDRREGEGVGMSVD